MQKALISLITGIFFMTGVLVVNNIYEKIANRTKQAVVQNPKGFYFKNHKIVPEQPTFTLEGELVNTRDTKWKNIEVVVSLFAGQAYMTYCKTNIKQIARKSHQRFILVCRETAGSSLPDNLTYSLEVKKALK